MKNIFNCCAHSKLIEYCVELNRCCAFEVQFVSMMEENGMEFVTHKFPHSILFLLAYVRAFSSLFSNRREKNRAILPLRKQQTNDPSTEITFHNLQLNFSQLCVYVFSEANALNMFHYFVNVK